jgi:hypothetical protein
MEKAFHFVYSEVSPLVTVGLCLLYFVGKHVFFSAYVLIFGWLMIGMMLLCRGILYMVRRGWISWVYNLLTRVLGKAWIAVLFGIEKLRDNWFGRVLALMAVCNLMLYIAWVYYNIDMLAFMRSTYYLICDCITSLFDPISLLTSFEIWKNSVPVLGITLNKGSEYVEYVLKACLAGNKEVLILIPITSLGIGLQALFFYGIANIDKLWKNWRNVGDYSDPTIFKLYSDIGYIALMTIFILCLLVIFQH